MKIIKIGTVPQDKIYQSTCNQCKTEFEFKQSEGRMTNDRNEMVLLVECPVCKKTLGVNP